MTSTLVYYASVIKPRGPLPGAILSQPGNVLVRSSVKRGVL